MCQKAGIFEILSHSVIALIDLPDASLEGAVREARREKLLEDDEDVDEDVEEEDDVFTLIEDNFSSRD